MRNVVISSLLCAVVVAACGGGDSKGGTANSKGGTANADKANAAVPAELKGKLRFVVVNGEDDRASIVAPDGWKAGMMGSRWTPPDDANLGFMTSYTNGTNCDGSCVSKEWPPIVDKVEFSRMEGRKVLKDEKAEGHRLLVVDDLGKIYIREAWWKKGGSRYFKCGATLDKELVGAAAAFEEACRATKINDW